MHTDRKEGELDWCSTWFLITYFIYFLSENYNLNHPKRVVQVQKTLVLKWPKWLILPFRALVFPFGSKPVQKNLFRGINNYSSLGSEFVLLGRYYFPSKTQAALGLKCGLLQCLFCLKTIEVCILYYIPPLVPPFLTFFLVPKSPAHFVPWNIRIINNILIVDTKKKKRERDASWSFRFLGVKVIPPRFAGTHMFMQVLASDVPKSGTFIYLDTFM